MKSGFITRVAVLSLAVATLTFSACKKDKSNPTPVPVAKKLSSIDENGHRTASFEYNPDGTLKKLHTSFVQGVTTVFTFTYDNQKRILEVSSDDGTRSKYVYENNVLKLTENFYNNDKTSENNFTYENGRVKSNTLFAPFPQPNGSILYKPAYRTVYDYYANGALQKISTYLRNGNVNDNLELDNEYVYQQYDSKKNPLAVISDFSQALMYHPIHVNNPLSEKMYNGAGQVEETTTHEYTYDAAGYPVTLKSTVTSTGGTPTVINTKFNY